MGYYDAPEGEACLEKLFYISKDAVLIGSIFTAYESMYFFKPKTVLAAVGRAAHWLGPFVGSAVAFGAVTCICTQIRKEDDRMNYIIGGASAGAVWGAKFKHLGVAGVAAVSLAAMAFVKKTAIQKNYTLIPEPKTQTGAISSYKWGDFTMNIDKDVPRFNN